MNAIRRSFRTALFSLGALAWCASPVHAQQAVWTQHWDLQSQISASSQTSDNSMNSEIADDFDLIGTVTEIRADGEHLHYFNSPPMNLQSAYVRFYEWQEGTPGALQYEELIPASSISVTASAGAFSMRIPLPVTFTATGRHFVSVQTISDLEWSWRTANTSPGPLLSPVKLRDRQTGSPWTTPRQSDVAFVLYGTLTGPPQLQSLSDAALPKSGRLRLSGVSFGTTRGPGQVQIGGLNAWITRWTNTNITAYVPEALSPGTHQVQVITANGASATLPLAVTARTSPGGQASWRFQVDAGSIGTPPVLAPDGTIHVMDDHGNLYALTPEGGLIWTTKSGFQGSRLTRGADGTLYTMADGVMRATNPDGSHKWDFTHPELNWTLSGPTVGPDGNIYGTTQNMGFGFFSVDPEGDLRWAEPAVLDRTPRGHEIVFSHGQAYINHRLNSVAGEWLMAFRMSDGELQWMRNADNISQPLIGPGGRIYVDWLQGTWRSRIYNPDGSLHLERPFTLGMRTFSPDLSKLYTSVNSVTAFDSSNLEAIWSADIGIFLIGPPTPDPLDRYLVARTHRFGLPGNLFALETTGHLIWREDFPSENGGSVIPTAGPIYSPDGNSIYVGTSIATYEQTNRYSYLYAFQVAARTPLTAPVAAGAVSRKTHGQTVFDLELPMNGTPAIEPRSGGANGEHQVVVSFTTPISVEGATATGGSISSYNVQGTKAIVNLTGVPNGQVHTVTLNGVNDGARKGPVQVQFATLLGDVNANGSVNAADVGLTKSQVGQEVTAEDFRADVNASGEINASDVSFVKSRSGTTVSTSAEGSAAKR